MVIVAITGTPGTGKDTISKLVSKKTGFKVIDLNRLAKKKGFFLGRDRKRNCEIVDVRALGKEIKKYRRDLIVQSHYSHELNPDIVIVLRTYLKELKKRLEKRGWAKEKIDENMEAEIMEVCKDDAFQKTSKVFEVDTTDDDPEKVSVETANIIFREVFDPKKDLHLPEEILEKFKRPYGRLFARENDFLKSGIKPAEGGLLISVGDEASYTLLRSRVIPDIIVIDGKVKRKPFGKRIDFKGKTFKVINKPGLTTRGLWNTMRKAIQNAPSKKIKISVVGEDDLAVLPAVVMSPIGSVILYGQPKMTFENGETENGLVAIVADAEKKKDAIKLFRQMENLQ